VLLAPEARQFSGPAPQVGWFHRTALLSLCLVALVSAGCSSSSTKLATYDRDYDTVFRGSLSVIAALSWEVRVASPESGFMKTARWKPRRLRRGGKRDPLPVPRCGHGVAAGKRSQVLRSGNAAAQSNESQRALKLPKAPPLAAG
jgi:hypothetical protein